MRFFLYKKRKKLNNKGISLLEIIIAVAIMAILVGVIVPQYVKYVNKARRSTDLANAEKIAKAFERVLINNPEFYDFYSKPNIGTRKQVGRGKEIPVQVAGEGNYTLYSLISSENFGVFSGTSFKGNPKNSEGKDIYEALNEELGIQYASTDEVQKWQSGRKANEFKNDIMVPQYKIKPSFDARRGYVDRWRICKRADGQLEIWVAENSVRGDGGGFPCYRLWPVPCDAYTE